MKKENLLLYRVARPIISFLFKIVYFPKYINKKVIPKKGRVVLAGSHSNNFDCLSVISSTKRTVHFLGKIELFQETKWKSWIFQSMGVIPVDRSKKKNKGAMDAAEEVLNKDGVIGIFPEGTTRKEKGTLLPFKFGAVAMAQHTNSKIIPFAITEEYRIFHKGLIIRYGEPLDVSHLSLEEANEKLRNEVLRLKSLNETERK